MYSTAILVSFLVLATVTFVTPLAVQPEAGNSEANNFLVTLKNKFGLPQVFGYQKGQKCPGKVFLDDCNICVCSEGDAETAFCSNLLCPPRKQHNSESQSSHRQLEAFEQDETCAAGEFFFKKCNLCRCSRNGQYATCTMIFCLNELLEELVEDLMSRF